MTMVQLPEDIKTGAMHDSALLVKSRGVTKRFGGLLAVNNVDFDIPRGSIVSLIGPPDAAFARARRMNLFMKFVFGLLSRKIISRASKRGVEYSFLFVHPDGGQLAEIARLFEAGTIRPVIDKVFPFEQTKEALAYLEQGGSKGKVVVKII